MEAEKIQQYVQRLPESYQAQVLDFVEFLLTKAERDEVRQEELAWSDLSLSLAMRDMVQEDTPQYTLDDLRVIFA